MTIVHSSHPSHTVGVIRRIIIISGIIVTTLIATSHMAAILPHHGLNNLERLVAVVFGVLFAWVSVGFWEAMAGIWTQLRRRDPYAITRGTESIDGHWTPGMRASLIMPIYNEDVDRVFARIRAMYESSIVSEKQTGSILLE